MQNSNPPGLIFHNEEDAHLVASWLYNCEVQGNSIIFSKKDDRAIETAIALSKIAWEQYLIEGAACLLPFPKYERECHSDTLPQIYVACLSAYNNGILHGLCIDATQDADSIKNDIEWMLSWSPCREFDECEEWAIHDNDNFDGVHIGQYENLENVSALGQAIEKHGEVMSAFLSWKTSQYNKLDSEEMIADFEDSFCGHYDTERDFAENSDEIQSMYNFAELEKQFPFWASSIDWNHVTTELFTQGYMSIKAHPHGVYVFRD